MLQYEYKTPSNLAGVHTWVETKNLNNLSIFTDEIQQSENNNLKSINAVVAEVFETQSINYENAK